MSGKVHAAEAGDAAAAVGATTAGRTSRSRHDLIAAVYSTPKPGDRMNASTDRK
jgi:hypothetical protein